MSEDSQGTYLVGIAGGSGSGKRFMLRNFLKHFNPIAVSCITQGNSYLNRLEQVVDEN